MNAKFKVLRVHVDGPHGYVVARCVSGERFVVSDGCTLGGVRLKSFPPGIGPDYTFRLENPKDGVKLKNGEIVELD